MKQKVCKIKESPPELVTLDEKSNITIVKTSENEKCLGGNLQQNLQWQALLVMGQDVLIPTLNKKLGSLKYLAGIIPQNCKAQIELILGKINYLLPLYGAWKKVDEEITGHNEQHCEMGDKCKEESGH